MAIKARIDKRLTIDLTGPDGNAYVLLGHARRLSSLLNLNYDAIKREMMSGDYENLIKVFDKNFGDVCDLER